MTMSRSLWVAVNWAVGANQAATLLRCCTTAPLQKQAMRDMALTCKAVMENEAVDAR